MGSKEIEPEEIKRLIDYHQGCLLQYRHYISPSAQYLEEQTIKALEELLIKKQ